MHIFFSFLFAMSSHVFAAESFGVASVNLGMLDVVKPVPFVKERTSVVNSELSKLIAETSVDVIVVQELWTHASALALEKTDSNYIKLNKESTSFIPLLDNSNGLGALIKRNLNPKMFFHPFKERETYICGWGLICGRGVQEIQVFKNDQKISVLNTHLTPIYSFRKKRTNQLKEILKLIKKRAQSGFLVFLAGDFNFSKKFGRLTEYDDGSHEDWTQNSKLYDTFLNDKIFKTFQCKDSYSSDSDYLFTQDRDKNVTAKASPSAGKAPSQRNDMIFICGNKNSVSVLEHKLVFDSPFIVNNIKMHLSDHFGVYTKLQLNQNEH